MRRRRCSSCGIIADEVAFARFVFIILFLWKGDVCVLQMLRSISPRFDVRIGYVMEATERGNGT